MSSRRRAFLWGSNGNERYSPLQYAKDDARALAAALRHERYGFHADVCENTSDPFDVFRALKAASVRCRRDDVFVAHFSGHGQIIGSRLYLVLDNSDPDDPSTLFSSAWLIEAFTECPARNRLLILDCCHAGAATGIKGQGVPVDELLPELTATQQILYASGRLEQAREFDALGGGFVTRTICRVLESGQSKRVSLRSVVAAVQSEAEGHNSRQQQAALRVPMPFLSGLQQGEFYFDAGDAATQNATTPRDLPPQQQPAPRSEAHIDPIRSLHVVPNRSGLPQPEAQLAEIRSQMLGAPNGFELQRLRDEAQHILEKLKVSGSPSQVAEARELERRLGLALSYGSVNAQEIGSAPRPRELSSSRGKWVAAASAVASLVLVFFVWRQLKTEPWETALDGGVMTPSADAAASVDASGASIDHADAGPNDASAADAATPPPGVVSIVFTVRGPAGSLDIVCKGARLEAELGNDRRAGIVDETGETRMFNVPSSLLGQRADLAIRCPGYVLDKSYRRPVIQTGKPVYVRMVKDSQDNADGLVREGTKELRLIAVNGDGAILEPGKFSAVFKICIWDPKDRPVPGVRVAWKSPALGPRTFVGQTNENGCMQVTQLYMTPGRHELIAALAPNWKDLQFTDSDVPTVGTPHSFLYLQQ